MFNFYGGCFRISSIDGFFLRWFGNVQLVVLSGSSAFFNAYYLRSYFRAGGGIVYVLGRCSIIYYWRELAFASVRGSNVCQFNEFGFSANQRAYATRAGSSNFASSVGGLVQDGVIGLAV